MKSEEEKITEMKKILRNAFYKLQQVIVDKNVVQEFEEMLTADEKKLRMTRIERYECKILGEIKKIELALRMIDNNVYRNVLILHYMAGCSFEEIGTYLDYSVRNVQRLEKKALFVLYGIYKKMEEAYEN